MFANKLILGTVQLGMDYGINNSEGKPSLSDAFSILNMAYDSGVRTLDTAEAYGDSQKVIGEFHKKHPYKKFDILSKFKSSETAVEEEFKNSLEATNVDNFSCYSFHRFSDVSNQALMNKIKELKKQQKIKEIGVSVYTGDELRIATDIAEVDIIQIPFNLFDNWNKKGDLINLAKKNGKKIHARSVFLQGLFYKSLESYPPSLSGLKPFSIELQKLSEEYNTTINTMALAYVCSQKLIDKVLIGVEKKSQLESNLIAAGVTLSSELIGKIDSLNAPEILIDPRNWK